jgi:adenosine/AMP kinase
MLYTANRTFIIIIIIINNFPHFLLSAIKHLPAVCKYYILTQTAQRHTQSQMKQNTLTADLEDLSVRMCVAVHLSLRNP